MLIHREIDIAGYWAWLYHSNINISLQKGCDEYDV
jgi:hypothetical protein